MTLCVFGKHVVIMKTKITNDVIEMIAIMSYEFPTIKPIRRTGDFK